MIFRLLRSLFSCGDGVGDSQYSVQAAEFLLDNGVDEGVVSRFQDLVLQQGGRRLAGTTEHYDEPGSMEYVTDIALVLLFLFSAACASGLTQGLLSLDYMEMKIKSESGTESERRNARKVLPIIVKHHLLLVTLMLWNATAMEALPIFLNKLVPEWLAIVLSVTLILFVGEIVPAAILTGPKQLEIAAALTPLVIVVITLFLPVAYPISLALDRLLGHDEGITQYNRREMATLVRLQHQEQLQASNQHGSQGDGGEGGIDGQHMHVDEVAIIEGALTYRNTLVTEVMTPMHETFMLSARERLNYKTLSEIFKAGYSRIPVFDKEDKNDVIGLMLVKDLIFVDPEDDTPVLNFVQLFGRQPTLVWSDDTLEVALSGFRQKQSHMALVRQVVDKEDGTDPTYKNVGIVTLEDIIETILGTEIEDEHDAGDALYYSSSAGGGGDLGFGPGAAGGTSESRATLRDFDLARLRLLNSKMSSSSSGLSEEEVRAVAAHLLSNVPQIQQLFAGDMDGARELVRRGMLLEMRRKGENVLRPSNEDLIYRRGIPTTFCTLILNGKVTVKAGRDEFAVELGAWSIMAADALVMAESQYSPDFVAFVTSDSVRMVRLSIFSNASGGGGGGEAGAKGSSAFPALEARKQALGLVALNVGTRKSHGHNASAAAGGGGGGGGELAKRAGPSRGAGRDLSPPPRAANFPPQKHPGPPMRPALGPAPARAAPAPARAPAPFAAPAPAPFAASVPAPAPFAASVPAPAPFAAPFAAPAPVQLVPTGLLLDDEDIL